MSAYEKDKAVYKNENCFVTQLKGRGMIDRALILIVYQRGFDRIYPYYRQCDRQAPIMTKFFHKNHSILLIILQQNIAIA